LASDTNKIYTTDIKAITKKLKNQYIVVFCTYQSCKLLEKFSFDICIFDEAHKTVNNPTFGYLLNDENCEIDKRIFLTATPRYHKEMKCGKTVSEKIISMNNKSIYGDTSYNYSFKRAIDEKYILDYQIVTYVTPPKLEGIIIEKYIKKDGLNVNANYVITAIQIAQHIKKYGTSSKILTYHNTVFNALNFKKTLNYIFKKHDLTANIYVMSGNTRLNMRTEIFHEFKNSDIGIICSAKVLNEGINLPYVDTVVFVDPRNSTIDVTQCVGRGMRLYKNQDKCTVIIPIHYDNVGDKHNFSPIIKILTAMNEIDDKIVEYFCVKKRNNRIVVRNMDVIDWNDGCDEFDVKYSIEVVVDNLSIKVMDRTGLSRDIKKNLLFEYCDKYKMVPIQAVLYRNYKIGGWLSDQKKKIYNDDDKLYIELATNQYVRANLEKYLIQKKKNEDKITLNRDRSKKLLFEYCDINKSAPTSRYVYRGHCIGSWLSDQKKKINSDKDKLYIELATNQYVKKSLNEYLIRKEKNKDKITLDRDGSKKLLFGYCDINKRVPTCKYIYNGHNIGSWFVDQKKKINSDKDKLYIELATNQYVKNNLNEYLIWKEQKKNKIKVERNDWKKMLFNYCNINKRVPLCRYVYNGHNIGGWLSDQKKKINSDTDKLYTELATNQYVKKSLDEYLARKEENKQKIKLNRDGWKKILFEYCDINKHVPTQIVSHKDQKIGGWLSDQKRKINSKNDKLYIELSANQYVKKSLDKYLDNKN
jgi:hypothetical protein